MSISCSLVERHHSFGKKPAASILRGQVKPGYLQSENQLCDCRHCGNTAEV